MTPDNQKKKTKARKRSPKDKKVAEIIKIMANTPPISNEEIKKQSKKRPNRRYFLWLETIGSTKYIGA